MNEFDLIKNYFAVQSNKRPDVVVGIGDDAAIVNPPPSGELAITTDTLVSGIHFPAKTHPYDIGYKSLAVNLSDLAAIGALPLWVTLALTLPHANEEWIQSFCEGFFTLANRHNISLIGGDLTHGPLSITVQAIGSLPKGEALLRSGAKPGDFIYVTGTLGDAGLALKQLSGSLALSPLYERFVMERLNRPEPRLATGLSLRRLAHAVIDISDGLASDLNHILAASGVGATIWIDKLPLAEALERSLSQEEALALALTAGDDYELCFTVPAEKRALLENKLATLACRYTCIGEITAARELVLCYQDGRKYHGPVQGYDHFLSNQISD